jgi:hypothetical protein
LHARGQILEKASCESLAHNIITYGISVVDRFLN